MLAVAVITGVVFVFFILPFIDTDGPGSSSLFSSPTGSVGATTTGPDRPSQMWSKVKEWRGTGMKETETFDTQNTEWRIKWKTTNEPFPNAGILQIFVYRSGGEMVSLAANKQGPGSDESYVRSRPGPHYLQINSGNIDWQITVEERR